MKRRQRPHEPRDRLVPVGCIPQCGFSQRGLFLQPGQEKRCQQVGLGRIPVEHRLFRPPKPRRDGVERQRAKPAFGQQVAGYIENLRTGI